MAPESSYGSHITQGRDFSPGHQRRMLVGSGLGILAVGLLVGLMMGSGEDTSEEPVQLAGMQGVGEAHMDTFCGAFDDPMDCIRRHKKHAYWTKREVREELWKTMKGLAELELRASEKSAQHSSKHSEQKYLLESLRKTLRKEMERINTLQAEISHKHTSGMEGISKSLVLAAEYVKNLTDSGLDEVRGKMESVESGQEGKDQLLLAAIKEQIENVSSQLRIVHESTVSDTDEVKSLAETVQRDMQEADARLVKELHEQEARADQLAAQQEDMQTNILQNVSREENRESTDFGEVLPWELQEGAQRLQTNFSAELDALERRISEVMRPGLVQATKGIDALRAEQDSKLDAKRVAVTRMFAKHSAADRRNAQEIQSLKRAQEEESFEADQRAAQLAHRIVEIGEDVVTAQQVLRQAQEEEQQQVLGGLEEGRGKVQNVQRSTVSEIDEAIKQLSARLSSAQDDLAASSKQIGAERKKDIDALTIFVSTALDELRNKVSDGVSDAQVKAAMVLAGDVSEQHVSLAALKTDLDSQAKSMDQELAVAHTKIDASDAAETEGVKVLDTENQVAASATKELVERLQKSIDSTKERLVSARSVLAQERETNDRTLRTLIKTKTMQLAANYTNEAEREKVEAQEQIADLLQDVRSRLGALHVRANRSASELLGEMQRSGESDDAHTRAQEARLSGVYAKGLSDQGLIIKRLAGLHSEIEMESLGLATAMRAAAELRDKDLSDSNLTIASDVSSLSQTLFSQLSSLRGSLGERVAKDLRSALGLIAQVGVRVQNIETKMHADIGSAREGQQGRDASSETERRVIDAKAQSLEKDAAREIKSLQSVLEEADTKLRAVRDIATSKREASKKAIGDSVDGSLKQLEVNITDLLALQSRELGASVSDSISSMSNRLDTFEQQANTREARLRKAIEIMNKEQEENDNTVNDALQLAEKHAAIRASDAKILVDSLFSNAENTQKTLENTEADLRKLLDDHWIALTDQIRTSLTNDKTSLLGTLGEDRDTARQVFADDVVSISSALAKLSNDTAAEDLSLTASVDAVGNAERTSHSEVIGELQDISGQQTAHKRELDALLSRLTADLDATNKALSSLKAQTVAKQKSDYAEVFTKTAAGLKGTEESFESTAQVSKEDLSSKLASDGKELRQRMADLSEHLVKEEQALSARIASWEEKAGVDRQEVSRHVADVTKGSSETETTARTFYQELSAEISNSEEKLRKTVRNLRSSQVEKDAKLRERLLDAVSALDALQRRVSSGSGLDVSSLRSSLAMLRAHAQGAARELVAKQALVRQDLASALSQGETTARDEEGVAVTKEREEASVELSKEVKASGYEVKKVSDGMAKIVEEMREQIKGLADQGLGIQKLEDQDVGMLEKSAANTRLASVRDTVALGNEADAVEHKLDLLDKDAKKERKQDLDALKVKVKDAVGSARAKLEEDVRQATQETAVRAGAWGRQLERREESIRINSNDKSDSVQRELGVLLKRAEQHYAKASDQVTVAEAQLKGLANSTQGDIQNVNHALDDLVQRVILEQQKVSAQQAEDREGINAEMKSDVETVRDKLKDTMSSSAQSLASFLEASIAGAQARLQEQAEGLTAMAQGLNSSVEQVKMDALSVISDQRENVSFVGDALQASKEELQRRVDAVDQAAKALVEAQVSAHGKSTDTVMDIKNRLNALAVRLEKTRRLKAKLETISGAINQLKAREQAAYGSSQQNIGEVQRQLSSLAGSLGATADDVGAKLDDEMSRSKNVSIATTVQLASLRNSLNDLKRSVDAAEKLPGPQGVRGRAGPPGAPGPQGRTGSRGATGDVGAQGAVGLPGAPGYPGVDGSPGQQGENGDEGSLGPPGQQGGVGSPGATGKTGKTGPEGSMGEKGEAGEKGRSGKDGAPGPRGPRGVQGDQGSDGVSGKRGEEGRPGPPGPVGVPGSEGSTGRRGPQGPQGTELLLAGFTPEPMILNWYSSASVRESMLSGAAQLGAAYSGSLQGSVRLPTSATWEVQFYIGTRSPVTLKAVANPDDVIGITINGIAIGVYKTPVCSIKVCLEQVIKVPVQGDVITYRLDFNSTELHVINHPFVSNGEITLIEGDGPEPPKDAK